MCFTLADHNCQHMIWKITNKYCYLHPQCTIHCLFVSRHGNAFGWLGCCWTWSCTWAWWYVRVQKIFAYEVSEMDRHNGVTIALHLLVTGWSKMYDKAVTRDVTQNRIMIAYKHFKVIISLYLSLNKRARGLSTLIMTHSEQRAC